jgi:hypothetical protein
MVYLGTCRRTKKRNVQKAFSVFSRKSKNNENWRTRIFVDFYQDEDVTSIFLIVSNYFEAVADKWSNGWGEPKESQILSRTTGFNALIRFLKDAYLYIVKDDPRVVEKSEFAEIFDRIDVKG